MFPECSGILKDKKMSKEEKYFKGTFNSEGVLVDVDISWPENFNFAYDVVDETADEDPGKKALVWCNTTGEEHIFTFADIRDESNRIANVFLKAGITKGDKVMVVLRRHYEYWFVAMALCKIGAVMIPVTHMLTAADFQYRLGFTHVRAIVVTPLGDTAGTLSKALEQTGYKPLLWSIEEGVTGFRNLTEEMKNESAYLERIETRATDHMLMYFTSGTTGYPKGVVHDHTYPLSHIVTAKYWQQAEDGGLHFTVAETGWAKASWGKLYGQWFVGSAIMVFDFDNFDPCQLANVINRYGVTSFCAPPTVYRYLVRKGVPEMPSLKHASTAGEFLSPDIFNRFKDRTGLTLHEGYGQTETALIAAAYKGQKAIDGSMGQPSPMYTVRLVDSENNEVPRGEIGEIVLVPRNGRKPLGVFCTYLDNEELYKNVWRGGVYHTGDSAWQDENGAIWFHGRFDDIIKSGGFRIGPYEIENVMINHPAVFQCAVIGVPDQLRGQSIKAFVILKHGTEPTKELEKEIKDFCNSRLAEYKWVRQIEFVDEFPTTISGKVRKVALREKS